MAITVYSGIWRGQSSRIVVTQDATLLLKFALSQGPSLVQAISFFADPRNFDPLALGGPEVVFPSASAGQAYAVIGPGQMGRCYVTNADDYFDLSKFWVIQQNTAQTNCFHYTVWQRTSR